MARRDDDDKEKELDVPEVAVEEVLDETDEEEDDPLIAGITEGLGDDEKAWE